MTGRVRELFAATLVVSTVRKLRNCLVLRAAGKPKGGMPAPLVRKFKRDQKEKREAKQFNPFKPPPIGYGGAPKTGAWDGQVPESERQRQGEFKSPWTGQVYDRWAPIGLKQKGTDRQGGLGRARAFETPKQRDLREQLYQKQTPKRLDKYMPAFAAAAEKPRLRDAAESKKTIRYAFRAGSFHDVFKQIVVQSVIDLKKQKSETPIWYIEPCGGEGEYHVSRLHKPGDAPRRPLPWPTLEDVYETLEKQDLTYMPMEIRSWVDAVRRLNGEWQEGCEDVAPKGAEETEGIQWLPSTAMMAMQHLRKQDPVTIFEDNPVSFAALFNFVRNFGDRFESHIELGFKDGITAMKRWFVDVKEESRAHGKLKNQRGIIFIDPDRRGGEDQRALLVSTNFRRHWASSSVVTAYTIMPKNEEYRSKWKKEVRKKLDGDLLVAEMYIDTPRWTEGSELPQWRGCGVLITQPPFTCAERIRAALTALCQELSVVPGASEIRLVVEAI